MASTAFDSERLQDAYPPGIERSWWHVAREQVIARAFTRHVGQDQRVLEVGCGTGIVTRALRARGWKVTGVDLAGTPDAASLNEDLLLGTDALQLPLELRASIDVIALFDVLEHIEDAPVFLRELLTAFPNARQVVVTVPARRELWTSFDEHYGHFRRYDRAQLRRELDQAGLAVDHVSYFFHGLYPAIVLNNLVRGRRREIRFQAPRSAASIAVNRVIGSCFSFEALILPGALVGSSIIAVAHRRGSAAE